MGATVERACLTCKKRYYCGHCSYANRSSYEARFPASEHEGHEVVGGYNEDFMSINVQGHLVFDTPWGEELYIANYDQFEEINLAADETCNA